jgi:hypothetical protein
LRPDPVFIIGMHRSGTSALGGALVSLGLTVGKNEMPPQADNPDGFNENLSLMRFHDEFLASINSNWHDPKPVGEQRFQDLVMRPIRVKLLELLKDEFGEDRALIKDPRLCRLMLLWVPLIREHFPQACLIVPIRHPVEVARSLRKRDHFALDKGLKLWVLHVLEGERTTRGFSRLFTTLDQLFQSPIEPGRRLAECLGLPADAVAAAISTRIDPRRPHQTDSSWPTGVPHEELTLSIYETLISEEPAKEEKLDRLRKEYYGKMGWGC